MPAQPQATEGKKKTGPKPPRPITILLAALQSALNAEVEYAELKSMVRLARMAVSTEQSYAFRMAARSLFEQAEEKKPGSSVALKYSDGTPYSLSNGGEDDDDEPEPEGED